MEKEFEITHLSIRRNESQGRAPLSYLEINIVFRMFSKEGKDMLKHQLEEYEKVTVFHDPKLLDSYLSGLELRLTGGPIEGTTYEICEVVNKNGIKNEDVFQEAYKYSTHPLTGFLKYHKKFDCFQVRECFQDNPAVRGIVQYLQDMGEGKPNPFHTTYYHQLICALESLCRWPD